MTTATAEPLFRTFTPDLEVRSDGVGRTIYGIAVPYGLPMQITDDLVEQFARGAFNHQLRAPQRVRFANEHVILGGTLIGAASELRDDAAGLYGEWKVSNTPKGDETLELVKDRALWQLSVMFRERQNRTLASGAIERVKADLEEVAVVMFGAYGDAAAIAGVRAARMMGRPVDPALLDAKAKAEKYLNGLPELPDYTTQVTLARLGLLPET